MKVKLFTQDNCPKCPAVKEAVRKIAGASNIELLELDISEVDGMAEAGFHGVMATPTTVVVDENEDEIASWRGDLNSEELSRVLSGAQIAAMH